MIQHPKKILFFILGFLFYYYCGSIAATQPPLQQNQASKWIRFEGENHISERQISHYLDFQKNSGFTKQQLDRKLEKLLRAYRDEGYLAARIDSVRWPKNPTKQKPAVVYLHEGEAYHINQLFVFGNRQFSLQQIRRWMNLETGQVFSQQQLKEDVQRLLDQYADHGYLLAKIDIQKLDIDHQHSLVDIVLQITENEPVLLQKIQIEGNKTTRKSVIVRELGVRPGDVITLSRLNQIQDRLRRLSFLRLIDQPRVKFLPDSSGVLELSVQEQNSSQFNGVLGYNPKRQNQDGYISGQIDLQFQNLMGTGRSFLAYWEKRGPVSQRLRLGYREPWLLGWPVHGDFGFHQNVQDTSFVRRSWHIGFQLYLFENSTADINIGQESVIPDSIGGALYNLPPSQANRLHLAIGFDSRNHRWNPTSGLLYQTSVDFVKKKIQAEDNDEGLGDQDFQRVSLDMEYVQSLFRRQVFTVGFHGRQVKIGGDPVPIDELYRLGGANDLRGYRDDQFLGSQVAWGSLEYRLLLERESRIGLFLDAGYIGRRNKENDWQQLFRIGYGFGLRTRTDLGVIGFDYGLGKGDNFSQGKIHIRLLNTF